MVSLSKAPSSVSPRLQPSNKSEAVTVTLRKQFILEVVRKGRGLLLRSIVFLLRVAVACDCIAIRAGIRSLGEPASPLREA